MPLRNWIDSDPVRVPTVFKEAIGGHPIVSQTLIRRGVTEIDSALSFMIPEKYQPALPMELPGMKDAIDHLESAIYEHLKICVWGDFDVDGQTATAILTSVLKDLGANIIYYIPDRATESHGINIKKLKDFISDGIQVLLSCDTGVSDHEAVEYAIHAGLKVIITDHHELPDVLPIANAIINPKKLDEDHPLSRIPGAGVAFKVAEELYRRYGRFENINNLLDLVALGIVADLALQVKDTRYLLQCGLEALRQTKRMGLLALMDICEIIPENITEEHIGYVIGPRLNALGRLSDASSGVELLLTRHYDFARELAITLDKLNEERKLITQQVFQAAVSQIRRNPSVLKEPILILEHPSWPTGVIGIVASRLVDEYHRPTILFTTHPNELARGSARSIEGINITAAISTQRDYLESYGGHPMAGGLSIKPELLPQFKQNLYRTLEAEARDKPNVHPLQIDGYIRLSELSRELVTDFERLAPFGPGNPPLVFVSRGLNLSGYVKIGRNDEHMLLTVEDYFGSKKQIIWWQGAGEQIPDREFDLAYSVRSSTYQGHKDIQVEWIGFRYITASSISIIDKPKSIIVFDYRENHTPEKTLEKLLHEGNAEVWAECDQPSGISVSKRYELKPANSLVIWTIPPGQKELQAVLDIVNPQNIYLFSIDPGMDNPKTLLKRLASLLKYTLTHKNGFTSINTLTAACAQRSRTIREAIKWLQLNGHFSVDIFDDETVLVEDGKAAIQKKLVDNTQLIKSLLQESAAYRAYYRRANKDILTTLPEKIT